MHVFHGFKERSREAIVQDQEPAHSKQAAANSAISFKKEQPVVKLAWSTDRSSGSEPDTKQYHDSQNILGQQHYELQCCVKCLVANLEASGSVIFKGGFGCHLSTHWLEHGHGWHCLGETWRCWKAAQTPERRRCWQDAPDQPDRKRIAKPAESDLQNQHEQFVLHREEWRRGNLHHRYPGGRSELWQVTRAEFNVRRSHRANWHGLAAAKAGKPAAATQPNKNIVE